MKTDDIKVTPKWRKSKDEVWDEIFSDLEEEKPSSKVKHMSFWRYAAAAVIAVVVAGSSFAYLYTTTETAARGTHLAVVLPDGSNVNLNAESQLKYKPYWWFASRNVTLTGEAYFEVKSGSRFSVKSGNNEVRVLGTSFNVRAYADENEILTTLVQGSVRFSAGKESVDLDECASRPL